jgi:hypothetical protein
VWHLMNTFAIAHFHMTWVKNIYNFIYNPFDSMVELFDIDVLRDYSQKSHNHISMSVTT